MSHIEQLKDLRISFETINDCTKNFDNENLIGKGGYGNVYKGILSWAEHKNQPVAVKRLDKTGFQGNKEFYTEITMLSQYRHKNIIALVGFCDEGKEMIVVYEYANHGSLDTYLSDSKMLDQLSWKRRLKICIGIASALDYLHNHVAAEHRVIHRDMKSANILLDEKWKPKLSDFGLSRIGLANQQNTFLITNVAGTHWYCDPQYEKTGILTKESDVYSFGVVLFEVLCGRLVCVTEYHDERRFLHRLVQTYCKNGGLETIVDHRIVDHIRGTKMSGFSAIAYQCLQETREKRPPIHEVVLQLKKLKDTREVVSSSSGAEVDVSRNDDVAVTVGRDEKIMRLRRNPCLPFVSDARPKPSLNRLDSPPIQLWLEKSETERPKRSNMLAEKTPRVFEEKLSVQHKLRLLNRMATVRHDGAVEFEIPGDAELNALGGGCGEIYDVCTEDKLDSSEPRYFRPLQVVILIVGTRGDVQPFVAIGKRLQEYGHRVRLATHANFKDFVLTAGLEFYPLGGDPKVLAEYMIKNKGFLPSGPSEIPVQRSQMKDIIFSLLAACKEPDLDTGIPFKADAMMANPPAYGHTHVAESLKIPIHIFSTMPWTPTSEFPHPLSRVKSPAGYRLSYQIVDSSIWLGIRDIINDVRKKQLKLRPVTYLSGSQGSETDIPHGYIWSHHLVPKPKDWGPKIDVVGFCFLDLASNYEPPEDLMRWLKAGPKPIYIGFGSLPVQEPEKMTQTIVKALEMTGQRGIINIGWGGIGILTEPKDFVYSLDNVPHDWLFLQCASVVHHGGAGTTAAGLKAACPTTIVPFFGDQPFWGDRVYGRGVGPPPIPVDQFTLNKLVSAINFMLDPKVKERAMGLAKAMENEDGVEGAVRAFLKHLPIHKTR